MSRLGHSIPNISTNVLTIDILNINIFSTSGTVSSSNIISSGTLSSSNIVASGTITSDELTTTGDLLITDITANSITTTNANADNITLSGSIVDKAFFIKNMWFKNIIGGTIISNVSNVQLGLKTGGYDADEQISGNIFTAKTSGYYQVFGHIELGGSSFLSSSFIIRSYTSADVAKPIIRYGYGTDYYTSASNIVHFDVGDYLTLNFYMNINAGSVTLLETSSFSGYMIKED